MRVNERIVTSQSSDDLGEHNEGIGDIDVVRAMGMTAASSPVGVSLWRLRYQRDTRELPRVQEGLREMAIKRGWAGNDIEATKLVNRVLAHWLDDLCHSCAGRGYQLVEGAPVLSDEVCPDCSGQGRVAMKNATEQAVALLDWMAAAEREVAGQVMRRLATEMEL